MIVIGGEADSDLNDLWMLSFEDFTWYRPEVKGHKFQPKRFHSASVISENRVMTFGGCHSEYFHLNDLHMFDFASFLKGENEVECTKIEARG